MKIWGKLILLLWVSPICALTVGSNTVPSRQGHADFSGVDNKMQGFAVFENGFTLANQTTTCSFDSIFPVSGTVDMNGGTLYLSRDLIFGSATTLEEFGSFYGNGLLVDFSEAVTLSECFVPGVAEGEWEQVAIDSDTTPNNRAVWAYNDAYIANVRDASTLEAFYFDGSSLSFADDITTCAIPRDVTPHPSYYCYLVVVAVDGGCAELRAYKPSGSVFILLDSVEVGLDGRAVDFHPSGGYAVAGFEDYVRVYSFISENLSQVATSYFSSGEEVSQKAICWDPTGDYFVVGTTHASEPKVRIIYFDGVSSLVAKDSDNTYPDNVTAVDWSQTGNFIAVGTDGSSNQVRVYDYNSGTDTLMHRTSVSVGATVKSVHWNSDATRLLVSTELNASGKELKVYIFDSQSYSLTLDLEEEKTTTINSVCWSHDDTYFVYCDEANNLVVYSYTPGVGDDGDVFGNVVLDNLTMSFKNDMSWRTVTLFQGDCIVDARDFDFTVEGDGQVVVANGATLTLKNAKLKGLAGSFWCEDNTSAVVLENCTVCLDSDVTFSNGAIIFQDDVILSGTNQFNYTSVMTSTIESGATLKITDGATFHYAPASADRDLLEMADLTSKLFLDGCTLKSTTTGLRLTNGTVLIDNNVTFSCDGTITSESICFGNGTESDDVDMKLLSGAQVKVYGGICYDNVG